MDFAKIEPAQIDIFYLIDQAPFLENEEKDEWKRVAKALSQERLQAFAQVFLNYQREREKIEEERQRRILEIDQQAAKEIQQFASSVQKQKNEREEMKSNEEEEEEVKNLLQSLETFA